MWASLVAQWLKKSPPANARHAASTPSLGRSPREGNGNPLHWVAFYPYPCLLENSMDRGAWRATVYGVTELDTINSVD